MFLWSQGEEVEKRETLNFSLCTLVENFLKPESATQTPKGPIFLGFVGGCVAENSLCWNSASPSLFAMGQLIF